MGNLVFLQESSHVFQPLRAAGQHKHLIAQAQIMANIRQSGFQAAVVGGQLFGSQREDGLGLETAGAGEKGIHDDSLALQQRGLELLEADVKLGASRNQTALLQQTDYVLMNPVGEAPRRLSDAGAVVD